MDKEQNQVSSAQVQRIEALCAEIDTWGEPALNVSYRMRKGAWHAGLSIHTGRSGHEGSRCFHAESEPLRDDGHGCRTVQEAFKSVCEQAIGAARGEMESIDKKIDELKARRLKLERAVGAFERSGGWGR